LKRWFKYPSKFEMSVPLAHIVIFQLTKLVMTCSGLPHSSQDDSVGLASYIFHIIRIVKSSAVFSIAHFYLFVVKSICFSRADKALGLKLDVLVFSLKTFIQGTQHWHSLTL